MASPMMWPILMYFIIIGNTVNVNEAMVLKKMHTEGQDSGTRDRETYELQLLVKNSGYKEGKEAKLPVDSGAGKMTGRGMSHTKEMIDQKRQPKPKHPIGNDIGTARLLHPSHLHPTIMPNPYQVNLTKQSIAPDHLEATVSVDFIMSTSNASQSIKDEESEVVSRQLHEIIDSVPTLPTINIPNMQFYKDPEEEALNQRITEVARQLAESALRKDYEEGKLGHILPLPSESDVNKMGSSNGKESKKSLETPSSKNVKQVTISSPSAVEPDKTKQDELVEKSEKSMKVGKSYVVANTLPLVSSMPHETAQLQLIAEVQTIPHYLVHEGFHPRTPPPELTGPLLGGPPLKPEEDSSARISKNIDFDKEKSGSAYLAMRLPTFLKLMSPKYGLKPNDLVLNVPVNGGPTIISTSDE